MVYPQIQYQGLAYPEVLDDASAAPPRELDSRLSDGIHVRLLWHPADGHISVAVHDDKTGEEFEIAAGEGKQAREVFHHPYAYAPASRGASGPAADVAVGERAAV
jgi:hypothetical protein